MLKRFSFFVLLLLMPLAAGAAEPAPIPAARPAAPQSALPRKGEVPITILSIIPAQGEPGTIVSISGSGFADDSTVFLATEEIPATVVGQKQLSFEIPELPPGLYALFVKRPDGSVSRSYSFTVQALKPIAIDLTPDTVYACAAASERRVTVYGHNFRDGSQVLFDGAAIRSRFGSAESLAFTAPQVGGGLHQVQVRNPDGSVSGVLGLLIDAKPELTNVTSGDEHVNYYDLILEGRNFQQGSTVVVVEERSLELMGSQRSVDVKRMQTGVGTGGPERDRVIYVDCNRIVYERYPYSTVPKNFKVQVMNPDGSESSQVSVSAP
ncbi:MAG TPA: IPT/TIG domain-containing protein [Geobacteraceae bacterium]